MNELSRLFTDSDLLYLVQVLIPQASSPSRMVKVLREDQDILEGMLANPALVEHLMSSEEEIVKISPPLLFAVLLYAVRNDLEKRAFTIERSSHDTVAVFDRDRLATFLEKAEIRYYLVDMLSSFVRVNSITIPVRVRKGVWHKYRISDFDIESLLSYSEMIEPEHRFPALKRIADLCLFLIGVFPETLEGPSLLLTGGLRRSAFRKKTREEITQLGKTFYEAASHHESARHLELEEVLQNIASHFEIAAKPLTIMSDNYLGAFKRKVFPTDR